ncbi:MAG TPA: pitrilysin family protein [Candidatus Paceibacterota bacterium]|nr:pitrilysin family protein [Candidatus Paceibacterota bacterium]
MNLTLGKFKESRLDNGLRIFTCEDKSLPATRVVLVSRAGSRYESKQERGYAHILEHMLLKGTPRFSGPALLAREVDKKGGYMNAFTNQEYIRFELEMASGYTEFIFELLADIVFNSLIDLNILEKEKKVILEEFKTTEADPTRSLARFGLEKLFAGHPLSQNALGEESSIFQATPDSLRSYKEKYLIPNRSAVIVAGDMSHDALVSLVEKHFSNWVANFSDKDTSYPIYHASQKLFFKERVGNQTFISYNFYLDDIYKNQKEEAAFRLLRSFLGYGQSSLLYEELRNKLSLIYGISASVLLFSDATLLSIGTSTSNPLSVIAEIEKVFQSLLAKFNQESLEETKAQTIGSFLRHMITPSDKSDFIRAGFILRSKLYTPEDYISEIKSVSLDDVLGVIKKYLDPAGAVVVAIGPKEFTLGQ